ncbi:hypothetical protein MHU86_25825 [Fragilaria crotonensis]|nr:hypothetical protein MHU86_25825 [Fragilaria crotonensis]
MILLLSPVVAWQQTPSRRRFLERFLLIASGVTSAYLPDPSNAVQGAAEYDLEYYMRDLFQGNPKQGTKAASQIPHAPEPRILTRPLQPLLLDDDLVSCIPYKVLSNMVPDRDKSSIVERVESIRTAASRSFQSKAPWRDALLSDQYYFDISSYAFWKTASELLPDYKQRDTFARTIGREIYNTPGLFPKKPSKNRSAPLTSTVDSMTEILECFTSSQYCTGYRVAGDKEDDSAMFDELDDNDLTSGGSVNCLVSIYFPATLGASLQITGEQSRFIPDFVGATLAAMWESAGIESSYETYFVDPEYRPNPKDYFPNEQLLQFTLTMASK